MLLPRPRPAAAFVRRLAAALLPLVAACAGGPRPAPVLAPPAPAAPAPVAAAPVVVPDRRVVPPVPGADEYVAQLLAAQGHRVVRWERAADRPIRLWIPRPAGSVGVADAAALVAEAMAAWNDVGLPVHFAAVADSAAADVRVHWVRTDAEADVAGRARLRIDPADRIVAATLALTTHAASGYPHPRPALLGYALHELGHVLGLAHTGRPDCVMFPLPQRAALCPADAETARRWYAMPTGLVAAAPAAPVRD